MHKKKNFARLSRYAREKIISFFIILFIDVFFSFFLNLVSFSSFFYKNCIIILLIKVLRIILSAYHIQYYYLSRALSSVNYRHMLSFVPVLIGTFYLFHLFLFTPLDSPILFTCPVDLNLVKEPLKIRGKIKIEFESGTQKRWYLPGLKLYTL